MPNIKKICLNAAVVFIFPCAVQAQQAAEQASKPNPHMESHVGNLTGHSEAGARLYYRYCW